MIKRTVLVVCCLLLITAVFSYVSWLDRCEQRSWEAHRNVYEGGCKLIDTHPNASYNGQYERDPRPFSEPFIDGLPRSHHLHRRRASGR